MAALEPPSEEAPPGPFLRLFRDRRIAFLIVGGFNTLNGLALFIAFHYLLGDGFVRYMATLGLSHVVAVLCAFVLHRRFVFRVSGHVWTDLARFEVVNLAALGLNAVLLPVFVEVAGLHVVLAQCAAGGLSVVSTYFAHRHFSFRRPAGTPLEDVMPTRGTDL